MFSHSFNFKRHQPHKMVLLLLQEFENILFSNFLGVFSLFWPVLCFCGLNGEPGCSQTSDMLKYNDILGQCQVPLK